MNKRLEQTQFYEVKDRISGILWHKQGDQGYRIFVTDWSGDLHILRFVNAGSVRIKLRHVPRIMGSDSPILSLDKYRSLSTVERLIMGNGEGTLGSCNADGEDYIQLFQDPERRPIAKVISVKASSQVFIFSWDRTMHYIDTKSKDSYVHKLQENFIAADYVHPYIVVIFGNNSIAFINVEIYGKGSSLKMKPIGYEEPIRSLAFLDKSFEYMALGDIFGNVKVLKKNEDSDPSDMLKPEIRLIDGDYIELFVCKAHFKNVPYHTETIESVLDRVVFPVNALDFNPKNPSSLFTTGSDATIMIIDYEKDQGRRYSKCLDGTEEEDFRAPITQLKFNEDGTCLLVVETEDSLTNLNGTKEYLKPRSIIRLLKPNPI